MLREFLEKLEQLVNIDSWSHDPAGISAVADVITAWFEELGWQVLRHDVGADSIRRGSIWSWTPWNPAWRS